MTPTGGPGRGQGFSPGTYQNSQSSQDHEQGYPEPSREGNFSPGVGVVAGTYPHGQPRHQYSNSSDPYSPLQRPYTNDSNRPLIAPSAQRPYPADHNLNDVPYATDQQSLAYPPEPYQQSSNPRGPPQRMASPATTNTSAFDFGSYGDSGNPNNQHGNNHNNNSNAGFGVGSGRRPSVGGYSNYAPSTAPPSYASRSPPPQEQHGGGGPTGGYPGYKPYQAGPQPSRGPGQQQGGW
jgi:hypothetical protein